MKARDYLAGKGLAIAGARGKFSNAAKEELSRALGAGVKFSDWPKVGTAPVPSKSGGPSKSAAAPSPSGDSLYLSPSDFRFPEDDYVAKGSDGKKYSLRECCNTCKVSLTNHGCNAPTIHGNITVSIERR